MASTSQAVKYSQMSFLTRVCHVSVPLLWHEMFLCSLYLIAVSTIKWSFCGSPQGGGSRNSHWPLCVQVTSPSHTSHLHPDLHMNTWVWKCCSTQILGLSLYHIMEFFPLHLVECSGFLIFFYITVILKYLLIIAKASKCWVVSLPSYLLKFLNILCWSAPLGSSSRVDNTWKKEVVGTAAFNRSLSVLALGLN